MAAGFQSSSSPKTGCKCVAQEVFNPGYEFQSSSSPKTGCKPIVIVRPPDPGIVSILIQPEDRMQDAPDW